MKITFKNAEIEDVPLIMKFIKELAVFEKMSHEVVATEELLRASLFGEKRYAEVIIAKADNIDAGFMLFFHNFSTFLGKPGIYLEDLYVKPEFRGKGIGKSLMSYLARLAVERKCGRLEWWVLKWNPARDFYENLGAEAMDDWLVYRLCGDNLQKLADECSS